MGPTTPLAPSRAWGCMPRSWAASRATTWVERLVSELAADGVDLALVVRTDDPTTIAHATLDETGVARYRFVVEGTASPALDRPSGAPGARSRAVGGARRHPRTGVRAGRIEPGGTGGRHTAGTLVMLDPNARPSAIPDPDAWRARIGRIARRADVIRASTDDLAVLSPGREPLAAAAALVADGAGVVIVTDGAGAVRVLGAGADPLVVAVPRGPDRRHGGGRGRVRGRLPGLVDGARPRPRCVA